VDDIISSGATLIHTLTYLKKWKYKPFCISVHGLFSRKVYKDALMLGAQAIITTNTISHFSNQIDIFPLIEEPLKKIISE
jgi:ribose-phosphate pyrophosphokinase